MGEVSGMEMRSAVGVVIFDSNKNYDPEGDNPGYRCLPGREPVRIYGTRDLPTNVRWLTNINLDVAYASRLQNSPKLLNTNYLRTSVNSILNELGLKGRPLAEQSFVVSNVFNNVMRLCGALLGVTEPPLFSLSQAIPSQIGHYQKPVDRELKSVSVRAVQSYGQCEVRSSKEAVFTSVVIPRYRHAKNILGAGLPWGDWRLVDQVCLPLKPERLEWIEGLAEPSLCKIKINRVGKKFNSLINYGAGAGLLGQRGKGGGDYSVMNDRLYASSNEIAFLSDVADIVIDDVYLCDEPVETRYELPSNDKMAPLSYSYGLLAENLWTCLDRDKDGKKQRNPMSAWLHAEDRLACIKVAAELSRMGYKILSYGYGRVTLALEPDMVGRVAGDCMRLGLIPPLGIGATDVVTIPDEPSGEDLIVGLFAQANLDSILDIDNLFTEKCCNRAAIA